MTRDHVSLFRKVLFLGLLIDLVINYSELFRFWKVYTQSSEVLYPIITNPFNQYMDQYFSLLSDSLTLQNVLFCVTVLNLIFIIINFLLVPNLILFIINFWTFIISNDKLLLSDSKYFVLSFSILFLVFGPSRGQKQAYNYQTFIFRFQILIIFFFASFHKWNLDQITTIPKLVSSIPPLQTFSSSPYWEKLIFFNSSSQVVYPLNNKLLTEIQPHAQRISQTLSLLPNEFPSNHNNTQDHTNFYRISSLFEFPGGIVALNNIILPLLIVFCLFPLLQSCFIRVPKVSSTLRAFALLVLAPIYFGVNLMFYNSFEYLRFAISLNLALYTLFFPLPNILESSTTQQTKPSATHTTISKTGSTKTNKVSRKNQNLSVVKTVFIVFLLVLVVSIQIIMPLRSFILPQLGFASAPPQNSSFFHTLLHHKTQSCWSGGFLQNSATWGSLSCFHNTLVFRFYVSEHKLPEIGPGTKQILPHFIVLQPIQIQHIFTDYSLLYNTSTKIYKHVFMMTRQNFKRPKITLDVWTSLNGRPYQRFINSTEDVESSQTLTLEQWTHKFQVPLIEKYGDWKWKREIEKVVDKIKRRQLKTEGQRKMKFYGFADFEGEKFNTVWKDPSQGSARLEVVDGEVAVFDMYTGERRQLKRGSGMDVGLNGWMLETIRGEGTSLWVIGFIPTEN